MDDLLEYTRPTQEKSADLEATGDLRAVVRGVAERTRRSPVGSP
jgi:hypothetical protein